MKLPDSHFTQQTGTQKSGHVVRHRHLSSLAGFAPYAVALLTFLAGCSGTERATVALPERLDMARAYSAQTSGDALLVWIGGELVLEDYPGDYDPEQPHILTEASALLSGLTALAAADNGYFDLDDRVSETLPEWQDDSTKAAITISQLLHLTSGLAPGGDGRRSVLTFRDALAAPLIHDPGEAFRYGPNAYQVFGALKERKLIPFEWLKELILLPMGIPGGYWSTVSEEGDTRRTARTGKRYGEGLVPRLFDGARLTPHQLGRIGRMLLQGGRWNNGVIIEDVGPLTQPAPASLGYGLGVWLNIDVSAPEPGGAVEQFMAQVPESILLPRGQERLIYEGAPPDLYMAAGRYNQRLYVIPSLEMVIVRLGRANLTWSDPEFLARLLDERSLSPSSGTD